MTQCLLGSFDVVRSLLIGRPAFVNRSLKRTAFHRTAAGHMDPFAIMTRPSRDAAWA
jgi:hypothetical protein